MLLDFLCLVAVFLVKVVISGDLVPWVILAEHPISHQGTIFIPWFIND